MSTKPAGKKRLLKGLGVGAAATGVGYGIFGGDSEEPLPPAEQSLAPTGGAGGAVPTSKESKSKSTTTQTTTTSSGYVPKDIKAPQLPALQELGIVEPRDLEERQKELAAARRTPEEKALFKNQVKLLDSEIKQLNQAYEARRAEAKDAAEAEALRARWAGVAESLANAAITIAAAQQGLARGQNIVGGVTLTRSDWQQAVDGALNRGMKERQLLSGEQKDLTDVLERKQAQLEREEAREFGAEEQRARDVTQAQQQELADVRRENLRREAARPESAARQAEKQAQLDLEAARASEAGRREAAPRTSSTTTVTEREGEEEGVGVAGARTAASQAAAKEKAYANLEGAVEGLRAKASDQNLQEVRKYAAELGVPAAQVDELIRKTTGEGMWNLPEDKRVRKILDFYNPRKPKGEPKDGTKATEPQPAQTPAPKVVRIRQKKTGIVIPVSEERAKVMLTAPEAYEVVP
jgi:hypothetical protein